MDININKIKVYFLGSGTIAVPVIERLHNSSVISLVGAGTQTDRPAGRNRQPSPTPVGQWTDDKRLHIDKIDNVNTPSFVEKLKSLQTEIVLVISFGQIIRKTLLELPGTTWVNIHASLLPQYRGASPIVSSIINRDECTGLTYIHMDEGLDTGPVYCRHRFPLNGTEKADQLEDRLGELSAQTVEKTIAGIVDGSLRPEAQDHSIATLSRKIKKSDGMVDWNKTASEIEAMVRAYHPWPGAVFKIASAGKETSIRISSARMRPDIHGRPGEVVTADKHTWIIGCGQGALEIERLVPQGKKEMSGAEFLRGVRLEKGIMIV